MPSFPSRIFSHPLLPSPPLLTTTTNTSPTPFPKRVMSTTNLPNPTPSPPPHPHPSNAEPALSQVLKYHHQTKHSFSNYARGPSNLDWANQPNPFRRYPPAPLLPLLHSPSLTTTAASPHYPSLFSSPPLPPAPLTHFSISQLFYDSLSLSAWKSTGFSTWSLRVNPSSGNLHPTESYLVSPPIPPLSSTPFVAHYAPKHHSLELRARLAPDSLARLGCPAGSFLLGLSSVLWRESWKYGERALRYCNHDAGHAAAAVAFAAAALGWEARLLDGLGYRDVAGLIGLAVHDHGVVEAEHEHADCVLLVFPNSASPFSVDYPAMSAAIAELSSSVDWVGKPNSLSKDHVYWDIIYRTAEAAKKPLTPDEPFSVAPFRSVPTISSSCYENLTVGEVVRKRRSAVDMDGVHVMERATFYQVLLHCMPMAFPFRVLSWDAQVHLALFVHRVEELPKGLYFLVRNGEHLERLRGAMRSGFEWEKPEGCPGELPLYRLARGDCQRLAKQLSCHQDIASDGCFSLGMISRFEPTLREKNAWMYPRLFWESGIIGQVLYLEAHAVGISATGIGCYFDDAVHEVLGLQDAEFQSLYHFTIGGPVVDKRIMSLPAYPGPNIDA